MPYTVMMVAAAGGSTRMGQPKQHIQLGNHPVLIHTLLTLQAVEAIDEILLIARAEDIPHFTAEAAKAGITKLRTAVPGGATRQASVAAGLAALPACATIVGIHDGARPLVRPEDVAAVINSAAEWGAAALAVPVKDTLKRTDENGIILGTPDRANLWRVQTPQVFDRAALCAAMDGALTEGKDYTDDCQLMEAAGHKVRLVQGLDTNLKLTTPEDIRLANALMKEDTIMRIGHGYDVHKLVEDRLLILGGVTIPYEKGLLGHSDADVLTHAVMDALLGAAALGDIGKLFPDNDPTYKGADSVALLRRVVERIAEEGYSIGNIDATILCQRPKLAPHIPEMRRILADACGVDVTCISVKATTEEGLGFTGSGEGIAAHCVCLLN